MWLRSPMPAGGRASSFPRGGLGTARVRRPSGATRRPDQVVWDIAGDSIQ
jgi:hypothetical protein